jgi:Domain of unknown function DUF29
MPRNSVAYDADFFAWTMEQARLLREGALSEIDTLNLAEEIESMGKNNRRELGSRLVVLLMHLLKWSYQPNRRSPSWATTVRDQRDEIEELLADSPSLRSAVEDTLSTVYARALRKAVSETGLPEATFPANCPFTAEQILSEDFLPEG